MADVIAQAVALLGSAGIRLDPGLREGEITSVEDRLGFEFSGIHRALLSEVLPCGSATWRADQWPDWRSGTTAELQHLLAGPIDGVVFDVRHNSFSPDSWGERPPLDDEAEAQAREDLAAVPRLVPIFGHRYLPAEPAIHDPPVFSIHQTDVIYYGRDLADYLARELGVRRTPPVEVEASRRVRFWSDLADGLEAATGSRTSASTRDASDDLRSSCSHAGSGHQRR